MAQRPSAGRFQLRSRRCGTEALSGIQSANGETESKLSRTAHAKMSGRQRRSWFSRHALRSDHNVTASAGMSG